MSQMKYVPALFKPDIQRRRRENLNFLIGLHRHRHTISVIVIHFSSRLFEKNPMTIEDLASKSGPDSDM
jgi:hypothetical protein